MNEHQIYRISINRRCPLALTVEFTNTDTNQLETRSILAPLEIIYLDYCPDEDPDLGRCIYKCTLNEEEGEFIVIDPIRYNAGVEQQKDDAGNIIEGGAYFASCNVLYYNEHHLGKNPIMLDHVITIPMLSEDLEYIHHEYLESFPDDACISAQGGDLKYILEPVSDE